ncbi:hypothetical protein UBN14_15930 [Helicobacter pylori]
MGISKKKKIDPTTKKRVQKKEGSKKEGSKRVQREFKRKKV